MEQKQKYTRAEAAAYIKKTVSALNTMATRQKHLLPFTKEGNKTLYTKAHLDAYSNIGCNPVW